MIIFGGLQSFSPICEIKSCTFSKLKIYGDISENTDLPEIWPERTRLIASSIVVLPASLCLFLSVKSCGRLKIVGIQKREGSWMVVTYFY